LTNPSTSDTPASQSHAVHVGVRIPTTPVPLLDTITIYR
jgi:hypothetical protein